MKTDSVRVAKQNVASIDAPVLGARRRACLFVLCLTLVIVSLDSTILNIAIPTLVNVLKATNTQLEWIVDSYAIVSAGLLIFAGNLGDRFGRKLMLIIGTVIFGMGSLGSAFSGSVGMLIASRAVMGIGTACIMPATLAIITNIYRRQGERALAIGIWSGTEGFGLAVGPIVGGWLLAHYWWGSVFLVNVPISLLGIIGALILIPESKNIDAHRIDWPGVILSIAGISAVLWGIIEAPNRGWHSLEVVMTTLGGLLIIGLFIMWESKSANPMLNLSFFKKRRFSAPMVSVALIIFTLMGVLFVMTQYLQFSLGYSAMGAGFRVLPVAIVLGIAAPISTVLDRILGSKVVVTLALLCVAAGLFYLATTTPSSTYGTALVGMIVVGIGAGLAFPPATESIMGSLPRESTGVGSAANSSVMQLGGALGVGVIGSILATRYQAIILGDLKGHTIPAPALSAIKGSLGGALEVAKIVGGQQGSALASASRSAFISGMDQGLIVGAVVVVVAAVIALFTLPSRPEKPSFTPGLSKERRNTNSQAIHYDPTQPNTEAVVPFSSINSDSSRLADEAT
ncbi:MAG: MFS transporter [Acidimicrobiales bacterium]|nr:MFS transporter [Acidimicrobiales bacterium]